MNCSIEEYGATSGPLCTEAVQKAVDACHAAGGGTVTVPAGEFLVGTIVLKSYVNLHLQSGGVLRGSTDRSHYIKTFRRHGVIYGEDAEQVSITGPGVIDARGTDNYDPTRNHDNPDFDRSITRQGDAYLPENRFRTDGPIARVTPQGMTVGFYHCSHVILRDVVLKDAPGWAIRIGTCEDVLADNVTILNNLLVPNSDGIHCTASRNVRIVHCDIRAGDDAIIVSGFELNENMPDRKVVPASERPFGNKTGISEHVNVSDCHLQSRSSGIRVGYGAYPIRRCCFSNLQIYDSNRGIGIYAREEATIEDLIFTNITIETRLHDGLWWGHGEPILVSSVPRFEGRPSAEVRRVRFSNILATGEQGIVLWGEPDAKLVDLRFQQVRLEIRRSALTEKTGGNFDLRPAADPKRALFAHNAPGIFARHVNGLQLIDVNLHWDEGLPEFYTHGLHAAAVGNLEPIRCKLPANPATSNLADIQIDD